MLKVPVLADDSIAVSNLRKQLATRSVQIAVLDESLEKSDRSLPSMTGSHSTLRMDLD